MKSPDALLNAIVSRNAAPELLKNSEGVLREFGRQKLPLFSPDYNWNNQADVREACIVLGKDLRAEVWDVLVSHIDDNRYSFTAMNNGPYPVNYSVGMICREMAEHRLYAAVRRHVNRGRKTPLQLDYTVPDLQTWRATHREKDVYELQLDVFKNAINELEELKQISENDRRMLKERLSEVAADIERKRAPLFYEFAGWDHLVLYNREKAEKIRRSVENP